MNRRFLIIGFIILLSSCEIDTDRKSLGCDNLFLATDFWQLDTMGCNSRRNKLLDSLDIKLNDFVGCDSLSLFRNFGSPDTIQIYDSHSQWVYYTSCAWAPRYKLSKDTIRFRNNSADRIFFILNKESEVVDVRTIVF